MDEAWIQQSLSRLETLETYKAQVQASGQAVDLSEVDAEIAALYEVLESAAEPEPAAQPEPATPFAASSPFEQPAYAPPVSPAMHAQAAPMSEAERTKTLEELHKLQGELSALQGESPCVVVEDEPCVRSLMRLMLQRAGYTVLEAEDGVQALELAAAHGPDLDLLVTDVVMPRMSGPQVADALRAARPGLSVIFISGYTGDAMLRHGVGELPTPFLQKPFTMTDLTRKVRQVLDQRAATV